MEDNARVVDPRADHLFDNHAQHGFLLAVTIDERLQGEMSAVLCRQQ